MVGILHRVATHMGWGWGVVGGRGVGGHGVGGGGDGAPIWRGEQCIIPIRIIPVSE